MQKTTQLVGRDETPELRWSDIKFHLVTDGDVVYHSRIETRQTLLIIFHFRYGLFMQFLVWQRSHDRKNFWNIR